MIEFPKRGRRLKEGYGLAFISRCQRYEVYKSDQVGGVKVRPVRWIAIARAPHPRIVSRHRSKAAAVKALEQYERQQSKAPARRKKP